MSDLLSSLKLLNFPISSLVQQPLEQNGKTIGWNVYAQNEAGISLAQGTHSSLEVAMRIAIAESFERSLVRNLFNNIMLRESFLYSEFPTSCGFACGFDKTSTEYRAVRESVERWAWSKWIDEGFKIEEIDSKDFYASDIQEYYRGHFIRDRVFLKKDILVSMLDGSQSNFDFMILVFETPEGYFAGCRAGKSGEDLYSHSAAEAFRNYSNYCLLQESPGKTTDSIVARRNIYFGKNKETAVSQIQKATQVIWPEAHQRILVSLNTNINGVYLWRSLLFNFLPWHLGDEKRFVY